MQSVLPNTPTIESSRTTKLHLRITLPYLLVMLALMICSGELHEQTHITTGYFICGGYGPRDFNVWQTIKPCAAPSLAFLATLAGPLWSYLVMWTGAGLLIKAKSAAYRIIGFSLVFAPLPFARIFTAVMGGGDEKVVLRALTGDSLSPETLKILAALIVTTICLPPILIAWRSIGNRFAFLYPLGFSVLPLIVLGLYVLTFLNNLLANGFLSSVAILGTPTLILLHFAVMAMLLVFGRKRLLELNRDYNPSFSGLK
jgi:hypothetical protein